MKYQKIKKGRFLSRENRFIAYVEQNGRRERVHVKNTGRCRELLQEGAEIFLAESENPDRKTVYDLVAVKKGERLINMDTQAPNLAVGEWLKEEKLFQGITNIKAEHTYQTSRFDFYVETENDKIFVEVKGVTLEEENIAYFPDAPSDRALKHVKELMEAVKEGYRACIIFVIQMEGISYFTPNVRTQPRFAEALIEAREAGVQVRAYDCVVCEDTMKIGKEIPVVLSVLDQIADPLLQWYDRARRILPWRENPAPYRVWVSEIMLQQTRVEAVKPYFERFMKALPKVSDLARIGDEPLMKLWEGLGYYRRAANLKRAAIQICDEFGGSLPDTYEKLLTLPGIGSYTAGAVASIAFGEAVPAVDGNVFRILARLKMDDADITLPATKKRIERELRAAMPKDRPGDFNQGLMELGATVCLPNGAPKCEECPWNKLCLAFREGKTADYPKKTPKKEKTVEQKTVLIIRDERGTAFRKRPDKGLLAGMYEFPTLEGRLNEKEVLDYLGERQLKVLRIQPAVESKHIFTHKIWEMSGYLVKVDELEEAAKNMADEGYIFIDQQEARDKYPIPSAYAAYMPWLDLRLRD